ncbi:hypothetical protein SEVIR_9G560250v4 [Setaria viridis]
MSRRRGRQANAGQAGLQSSVSGTRRLVLPRRPALRRLGKEDGQAAAGMSWRRGRQAHRRPLGRIGREGGGRVDKCGRIWWRSSSPSPSIDMLPDHRNRLPKHMFDWILAPWTQIAKAQIPSISRYS